VIVSFDAAAFGDWEGNKFSPEAKFIAAISKIKGVSKVETQTFTIMPVEV
jgi:hypothetical protein